MAVVSDFIFFFHLEKIFQIYYILLISFLIDGTILLFTYTKKWKDEKMVATLKKER